MKTIRIPPIVRLCAAAAWASFFFIAVAHPQAIAPAYQGRFTLPYEVQWGGSTLPAGSYVITIKSIGSPVIALIRSTGSKDIVTYVQSGAATPKKDGRNALLIASRDGKEVVHSLALSDVGLIFVYDPTLAHPKSVPEARTLKAVSLFSAKK
jgi:hypothetical protein